MKAPTFVITCLCFFLSDWSYAQAALDNPLFVFNSGFADQTYNTPEQQIRLVEGLGYDGIEKNGLDNFTPLHTALQASDLKLYAIYIKVDLDNPEQPYDPRLEESLKAISGSDAMPWLYVMSKKHSPSSSEYDTLAVPILQSIADLAWQYEVDVMLYPHMRFWLESVEDAIRIARKVNRRNLGLTFNQCHYLAHKNRAGIAPLAPLDSLARLAMPYLFAISINGADTRDADQEDIWDSFIKPLGEGDFDTYAFIKAFVDRGFSGPVGLQCYNIKEDKPTHLRQSMQAWQRYQKKYAADQTAHSR